MAMRFVAQRKRQRTQTKDARSTALVPVSKQQAEVNLARKVAQLSKYVKGLKPEMKFADVSLSASNVSPTTGVTTLMSAIAAGTGVNQRVGENVQVKYIEMHFEAIFAGSVAAATNDNPSYRVYIVQDKQQISNTSPGLLDLVDQPSVPTVQLFNVQEQKRFRVIYDSGPQVISNRFVPFSAFLGQIETGVSQIARYAFLGIWLLSAIPQLPSRPEFFLTLRSALAFLWSSVVLLLLTFRRMGFISWSLRTCWLLQLLVSILMPLPALVILMCNTLRNKGGLGAQPPYILCKIQPDFSTPHTRSF